MQQPQEKPVILVVDDTPSVLELLVGLLHDEYALKLAHGGLQALKYLEQYNKLDLILLDVMMPEIDGFEVCKIIKSDPALKHIPVMFITVLEKESDVLKGFELGAVDYVTKPFEPKVLKARVKTHVQLKQLQDKLERDLKAKDALLCEQAKLASMGEMLEQIAHQWKQPLSVISLGSSDIRVDMELDNFNKEETLKNLDIIDNSVEHMIQTMSDFKDFIQQSERPESFNLKEVIDKTIKLVSARLSHTLIKVENNVEEHYVHTYRNDFIQVVMNILNNAIEALAENYGDARITIASVLSGEYIEVRICDNAGGIDAKMLGCLFDKYTTTKSKKNDSGLGLYIAKKIMQERLIGDINAYNVEGGACFELSFAANIKEEEDANTSRGA